MSLKCDHTFRQKAMFTKIAVHRCDYCSAHITILQLPCHTCGKCDKFWHAGCFQQILRNREAAEPGAVLLVDDRKMDDGSEVVISPVGVSPLLVGGSLNGSHHIHDFAWKTFWTPKFCTYCKNLLAGLRKQGLECKTCDTFAHEKCIPSDINHATICDKQHEDVKTHFFNHQTPDDEQRQQEAKGAEQLVLGNTINMLKMVNRRNKRLPQSAINPANMLHLYKKHAELYKTAVSACPEVSVADMTLDELVEVRSVLRYATAAYGRAYDEGYFANNFATVMLRFGNMDIKDPKPEQNTIAVTNILGCSRSAICYATWSGEVYKPNYYIMHDKAAKRIVLAFRGSLSDADFLTDATGELVEFTKIPPLPVKGAKEHFWKSVAKVTGTVEGLGLAHKGISTMVQEVFDNTAAMAVLQGLMATNLEHHLIVTGHSLGAGLTNLFVVKCIAEGIFGPENHHRIRGFGFAPPPTVTHPLADRFDDYIFNFVAAKDAVSRLQYNSTDRLCQEIATHAKKEEGRSSTIDDSPADLTEETSIPGRIFLFTKPNNLNTKLISPKRSHILLHQVFLSKYMLDNHHMDNYDDALDAVIKYRLDSANSSVITASTRDFVAGKDDCGAEEEDEDDCEHNEKSWSRFATLAEGMAVWAKEQVHQAGETVISSLGESKDRAKPSSRVVEEPSEKVEEG